MSLLSATRRYRAVGVACAVALLTGCGPEFTAVSGKVTQKGRPVVYGTVTVIGSDQATYYTTIQLDGTYSVAGVPVGPAKFAVYSPDPYYEPPVPPAVKARMEEARRAAGTTPPPRPPKGKWFRIPPKYADPVTSGLAVDLEGPTAVFDIRVE
ncbi:unnamed protein product [Gemmataceae bacterium]|nr:unnamed protein product [Gemmataceae bacterium]VTT96639.1 unnamed protein product [Gemmataceae bacterium]